MDPWNRRIGKYVSSIYAFIGMTLYCFSFNYFTLPNKVRNMLRESPISL